MVVVGVTTAFWLCNITASANVFGQVLYTLSLAFNFILRSEELVDFLDLVVQ